MIKKIILLTILSLMTFGASAQVRTNNPLKGAWTAKEFSKEVALFRAKSYLYRGVLGVVGSFETIK